MPLPSKPPTTPLSRTHAAALSRVLDAIPRGYVRYTSGVVASAKLPALVSKFHRVHAVAATPAQRMTRKKQGKANAILALYQSKDAEMVLWLLLFTPGELGAHEVLKHVADKPRLSWLGYELSRHNYKESTRWTWRRPREAMQELYAALDAQLKQHHWRAVEQTLQKTPATPRLAQDQTGAPRTDLGSSSFFKTPAGIITLVAVGAGVGYALYSTSHDRIKSPGR